MTVPERARACASEIVDRVGRGDLREAPIDLATRYIEGAIKRALDEAAVDERVVNLESGHVSIDVGTTAKGDYQYSAKIVMPFAPGEDVAAARERAQAQLEQAEAFLKQRYGRVP